MESGIRRPTGFKSLARGGDPELRWAATTQSLVMKRNTIFD
jgi:hypothetical protein